MTDTPPISRRNFLGTTAAGAAALAMPSLILSSRANAQQSGTVRMLGSVTTAPEDWSEFEAATGLTMEFTPFNVDDIGALFNEIVVNGGYERYDLIGCLGGVQKGFIEQGVLAPLDTSRLSNHAGVQETISRNPLLYTGDDVDWGVPTIMNADAFGYFPDALGLPRPPELLTWDLLLNSEDTLGLCAMEADQIALMIGGMYMKTRELASIEDPANMTPEECREVGDWLIERKRAGQFRNFWSTYDEQLANFLNGEVLVQRCWEPVVKDAQRQGHDVHYAYCSDFHVNWMHAAFLTTSGAASDRLEEIYAALDWFMSGAYAADHAIRTGYTCARMDLAMEYVQEQGWDPEQIAEVEANTQKVQIKLANPNFWITGLPDEMAAHQEQAERLRNA